MRVLVSIFAALLILISLYQLSFTWFVNKHEQTMERKAQDWVSRNYVSAERKYPGNKELQAAWQDSLNEFKAQYLTRLLDSTRDTKITWWGHTYQKAKESELLLGLDLQGGINVTLDVALDGLIRGLANNPRDPQITKAIEEANRRKVSSDADYITLFSQSFKAVNPGASLAPHFANSSRNKLKIDDSDNQVINFIREQAKAAMQQTYQVITKRIDKFGVAQPNVNLDENKGIINVELAGAKDPERVRRYLQSTANLQFWEVYTINEIGPALQNADKALESWLNAQKASADTSKVQGPAIAITSVDTTGAVVSANDTTNRNDTTKSTATAATGVTANPLLKLFTGGFAQGYKEEGRDRFPGYIGGVAIKDTAAVNAYLNNPVVRNNFPSNVKFLWGKQERDEDGKASNVLLLYAIKTVPGSDKARLEGDVITDAYQDFEQVTNRVIVHMTMNKQGDRIWEKMTTDAYNAGKRPIAIVLDDIVYSAPSVNQPISGGSSTITMGGGNSSQIKMLVQEGQDLANILKSGKLEAPAKIVQEQTVGPTLGQEAIKGGTWSFVISFAVIFLLMLIYFNTAGWVANITLILNLLFTVGILSMFGFTLTAAGIAGLVLTIGMAVDTNVIIFERIKEELTKGKSYNVAFREGYRRSLAPVLDGHVTTLLTACILAYFGLGPVLGFATTQIIGIIMSLFCGIVVAWLVTDWWTKKGRHFKYFTALSQTIYRKANFKFIEYRKIAYIISVVVLGLGIGAFINGFNEGVEFSGGRSYIVNFGKPVQQEAVAESLEKTFGSAPIIKTYGGSNQLDITTDYLIEQETLAADSTVVNTLYAGLQPYLPQGTTAANFAANHIRGTKKVVPTISDDLKQGAMWATFWSLLMISLYIFIRFRDWRYAAGTIVALMHDVLVMIIVFSFFRNIVPFPLEIDQHFIAAILTVIGFSMNDTVVVFDRIREYAREMKGADKRTIINRAINDTLTRTIMTSLTVFLTLLILFLVGGEVTRGFAFAMLIGVLTGIYSSVFVAAPILVDIAKNKPLGQMDADTQAAAQQAKGKPVMAKMK
ncbi:MAG TPA: protein translocase subunit SecDF [Chitinophagaceae bacterium]|nr:protein translocase subunit SecDF [Chitinophagaceae bacterium]